MYQSPRKKSNSSFLPTKRSGFPICSGKAYVIVSGILNIFFLHCIKVFFKLFCLLLLKYSIKNAKKALLEKKQKSKRKKANGTVLFAKQGDIKTPRSPFFSSIFNQEKNV